MEFLSNLSNSVSTEVVYLSVAIALMSVLMSQSQYTLLEKLLVVIVSLLSLMSIFSLTFFSKIKWQLRCIRKGIESVLSKVSHQEMRLMDASLKVHELVRQISNYVREYDGSMSPIEWVGQKVSHELMVMRTIQWRCNQPVGQVFDRLILRMVEDGLQQELASDLALNQVWTEYLQWDTQHGPGWYGQALFQPGETLRTLSTQVRQQSPGVENILMGTGL